MALSDHAWPPENDGQLGPFVASDDDVFIVGHGGTDQVEVLRSTDGGATFGTPVATTAGRNVQAISATQSGQTLYVVWATVSYADTMTTRYDLEYQEFAMGTNTWSGSVDTVDSPDITDAGMGTSPSVARRTSDSVILYTGDEHADMGSGWRSVVYARGTAGSWGTTGQPVAGNAGSVNWSPGGVIVGSQAGECHFVWVRKTTTGDIEARTLDGSNSLSTTDTANNDGISGGHNTPLGPSSLVTWDDAGTQRIAFFNKADSGGAVSVYRWEEDASDDMLYTGFVDNISDAAIWILSVPAGAVDPTSDDTYVFWQDGTTRDLFYDKAADAASGSWGTDVEAEDAITAGGASANGFTYPVGGSSVIAYIVDDTAANTVYGEVSIGAGDQTLTGVLFTKAPTFPTGAVQPQPVTLAGVLFTRAPTFGTGQANFQILGVVYQQAPTFAAGQINLRLLGSTFQRAPTFPAGQIQQQQTVTGVLFSRAPTFLAGQINFRLLGGVFAKAPTFPTGQLNFTLIGVLFSRAPTFPIGQVNLQFIGAVFSRAPTFPTGAIASVLTGVLFTRAPTFPTGQINLRIIGVAFQQAPTFPVGLANVQQTLTGTLFTKAPTFPAGTVTKVQTLSGVLFTRAPTFGTGQANLRILGVLFSRAPTFPTGVLQLRLLGAATFTKAPTFPTGQINFQILGAVFVKAPTFPTGEVQPQPVTLTGILFTRAPTFPTGQINLRILGVLFTKAPTFPAGQLNLQITGSLFTKAPTFPTGVISIGVADQTLNGTLFTRAPTFPAGVVNLQLAGSLFTKAPTFPTGQANLQITGTIFTKAPTFPTGALIHGTAPGHVTISITQNGAVTVSAVVNGHVHISTTFSHVSVTATQPDLVTSEEQQGHVYATVGS